MKKQCPKCEATDGMLKTGRYSTAIAPCSHTCQKARVPLDKFLIVSVDYAKGTRTETPRLWRIKRRRKLDLELDDVYASYEKTVEDTPFWWYNEQFGNDSMDWWEKEFHLCPYEDQKTI